MGDVVNTHMQLHRAGGGVAIIRGYQSGGAACGYDIYRIIEDGAEVPTDPNGPWYVDGRLRFLWSRHGRMPALHEAKAYVAGRFGYKGAWTRNAMGDYVPAVINKKFPIRRRKA